MIMAPAITVLKRDKVTRQSYDRGKIVNAVTAAFQEVKGAEGFAVVIAKIVDDVQMKALALHLEDEISVELIQDCVELALMKAGHFDVAKAYILYRAKRADARETRLKPDSGAIADYVTVGKYSKYLPEFKRRETWHETVARVEEMHLKRFQSLKTEIRWAFDMVRERRVLPAMRSCQFAGPAIETNNMRGFNCSFSLIDRPRAFAEAFWILLSGCGVGYSVQFQHVEKLPALERIDETKVVHWSIVDTIEGWAEAVEVLFRSYMSLGWDDNRRRGTETLRQIPLNQPWYFPELAGRYVEFDYSAIRSEGSPLKTSGGKAPGHMFLKKALEAVRSALNEAQGRQLQPIECHDILCHLADAVLSGGVRRSSMLSLFSPEDGLMMQAKTGTWAKNHKHRENANNSAAILRSDHRARGLFKRLMKSAREWGDPGVIFLDDLDWGVNPCGEILLNPVWESNGQKFTGWALCNLTEINMSTVTHEMDYYKRARAATLIGTLQASYTDFPFLSDVTRKVVERDALIGVGMTGMADSPGIAFNYALQARVATAIKAWNEDFAAAINIRPAKRCTTVKPSGTSTLAVSKVRPVASGIHPHHARRYIRRVTANENENIFQYFKSINPHMCVKKPDGDWVIEFPIEVPANALTKQDLPVEEFFERVLQTQQNWIKAGGRERQHNVSNTIYVQPHEWETIEELGWANRDLISAFTVFASFNDKAFAFAPMEAVVTEADEARFNELIRNYKPVDYTLMVEEEDNTVQRVEPACAGGACEVKL